MSQGGNGSGGSEQQRPWGKRLRDDGDGVRFSDLSPEQKMQRRRQERAEKKGRERTLAYFKSVQRTMDEHGRSGDPTVLANIVDGFFGELLKLLKEDPSFHLLRNGVVCRAIEAALGSAVLLQSKTLLYVFLGHVPELVTSPVASYTFETLMVSLSLGLSALCESNAEGFEAEMLEGGPGTHTGSGVPSTATLLRSMVDELTERAADLLVHEVGSRALRSIITVLGGHAIRNAPPPARPVTHSGLLGALGEAVTAALEESYGSPHEKTSGAAAWLAAAQVPTTSFVVQSLLRVSEEGSPCFASVVGRMEGLVYKGKPLLWHLMTDRHLGSHLFQAYLRVPVPTSVREQGDAETMRLAKRLHASHPPHPATPQLRKGHEQRHGKKASAAERLAQLARDGEPSSSSPSDKVVDAAVTDEDGLLACCWGKGMRMVQTAFSLLISGQQLPFILQDLVLAAPTAAHLYLLWDQLLAPHLPALLGDSTPGAAALAVLARKCAFAAAEHDDVVAVTAGANSAADASSASGGNSIPADINAVLRADEGQGMRYFSVPSEMQRTLCEAICAALAACGEGETAAHHLLVDGTLGERGVELARYLLHLHPTASSALQRGIDGLSPAELLLVAESHKGSVVLQQYLRAAAYWTAVGKEAPVVEAGPSSGGPPEERGQREAPLRLLRKVEDRLYELVYSKYGAFVVETLYEVGSVTAKEATVKALLPIYESLKDQPDTADKEESMRRHVARKVVARCCVEQYTHRRDDWLKLAQRQVQVQRLMWRMVLEG